TVIGDGCQIMIDSNAKLRSIQMPFCTGAIANYLAGVIADQTSQASFDASGAINYSINAYIEVFDQITWGALACVGLVLMIWLYQALKFRNRALALES
ncbi:UNVERIFIED_CONTAM: hypothetical protein PO322_25185, partial [Escherichia coli]